MLRTRTLFERDGITIADVACRHEAGRGQAPEYAERHALVFVRRGCFVRSAQGRSALLDPTTAYCVNPGEEQRYDHPHVGGDDCTSIGLDRDLVASLCASEDALPCFPLASSPRTDLEHRLLLAAARRGAPADEVLERALVLAANALAPADRRRVDCGRPASARARRALADGAREALAEQLDQPLPQLARTLAVSPHHLSRVFHAVTGRTIARHRMRLRARRALEHLAGGEQDLARLAAELGFADQSHLCRVVRAETGHTPGALRRLL